MINNKVRIIDLDHKLIEHESGYAYRIHLEDVIGCIGDCENNEQSIVLLLEDGKELGPSHSPHHQVRELGVGRYSHWTNKLIFSTSDNSAPTKNRRRYQLIVPPESRFCDLRDPEAKPPSYFLWDSLNRVRHSDCMSEWERYSLARSTYEHLWSETVLPDIHRSIDQDSDFQQDFALASPGAPYSAERKYNLRELLKLTDKVAGDIAECGTYKGASAYFIKKYMLQTKANKTLFLFDSFSGLSAPESGDGDWWHAGDLSSSAGDVRKTLDQLPGEIDLHIKSGWIPSCFDKLEDLEFSFAHIDVDLYSPTKDSLSYLYPRMNSGGVIFLDDYACKTCPGATQAIDEYMSGKREHVINLSSGGAFIIKE